MSDTPPTGRPDDRTTNPAPNAADRRGPIRNGLESIGMAVLMAVLLKYFVLEAYVIPTPSMQPTMMGSPAAGESDRILVDKSYYLLHEPKRWDIVVFRYPVRQVQSYVKRIVGVGGDRIKIAAGNLYDVGADGKRLSILRKPDRIQATLWREIYPMRQKLELFDAGKDPDAIPATDDVFNSVFRGRGGKWKIDPADGAFVATPTNDSLQLTYNVPARNDYVDGYDLAVASTLRKSRPNVGDQEVHDLAIDFDLTPAGTPQELVAGLEIVSIGVSLRLEVKDGKGTLRATRKAPQVDLASPPFDFPITAGSATHVRFEHRDDRLFAFRDGDLVSSFDVDALPILTDLEVGSVSPRITVVGKGECRFGNMRIERDLHYTHSQLDKDAIIEVPEGHFFMMGDNTLGSADGRDWTAIQIGVDKDDNIVNPKSPAAVRTLWGNKRPKPTYGSDDAGHDDDNPVPMFSTDQVVFVDEMGEIHALKGKVDHNAWATKASGYRIQFLASVPWSPPERPSRFVPRRHIQGRPIARFLRSLPGLKFVGWIR